MKTKEYKGNILYLEYPEFLKMKRGEPEWYAVGPKGRTTVVLNVDPEPNLAAGFARLIRNPHFTRTGGARIDREGNFQTKKGIEGFERVARLVNPLGTIETRMWMVDGKLCAHVINIQITTVNQDWYNGVIWEALLNSIDVFGRSQSETAQGDGLVGNPTKGFTKKGDIKGILRELPSDLRYLLDLAAEISSLPQGDLATNPKLPEVLSYYLRKEMEGLSKENAKLRVRTDRERLWDWLQRHPVDTYPETAGLHVVVGALLYAGGIFAASER